MTSKFSLANRFIIAMPKLEDPTFAKSVVYIYEHNENGAAGMVINKPLNFNLGKVLDHLNIPTESNVVQDHPVLSGGPLGLENGFVIFPHTTGKNKEIEVFLSSSKDVLRDIALGQGPMQYLIALGYAAWEGGQLEEEIVQNDWFVAPVSAHILFETPFSERWNAAAASTGIDVNRLSDQVGHA